MRDLGKHLLNHGRAMPDGIDAVVHEINLPAARQFQLDRGFDHVRRERRDHRMNRQAILGRRLDHRQIAQPEQRHVQRARDRRRAHGDGVDAFADFLEPLFVLHAEALLFVDDDEPEIFPLDVFREQPVRADHEIHFALGDIVQHGLDFFRAAEAAQHFDAHRERLKALLERLGMLESTARWWARAPRPACHRPWL